MNDALKRKINDIWINKKKCYKRLFTTEELNIMGGNIPKFIWDENNDVPLCSNCKNSVPFISLKKGYEKTCKKCNQIQRVKNTQNTMLKKYGYVSVFKNKDIHEKALTKAKSKEAKTKRLNKMVKNNTLPGSELVKAKSKQTKLEKYGDANYTNVNKTRQTKLEKYGDTNYNNRHLAKKTMLEKYGVDSYAKLEKEKKKIQGLTNRTYTHFKNLHNFNDEFIINKFVKNKEFDLISACLYFNCTWNTFRNKEYYKSNRHKTGRVIEDNLKGLFGNAFEYNNRTAIPPLELDMYDRINSFGVEYNGLYWHSNIFKEKNYHLIKTEKCEEKKIQLFHIFENEWIFPIKQKIWLSIINNKLNNSMKIGARKTKIHIPNNKEAKEFLLQNHLQGNCSASVRIGLYYNKELVSLMTFGKARFNKKIEWELLRFCTKINMSVCGGASKLLRFFEKTYNPKTLISYANRRWSQGNVYEKLCFKKSHTTPPNFFYVKKNIIYNRITYQKHKLKDKLESFDENLSERENMLRNGFTIIHDSGNIVFYKNYEEQNAKN